MALDTTDKPEPADSVLDVLKAALGDSAVSPQTRICAARDPHSAEEGLALLTAYIAIEQPAIRQAILDAVLGISQRSVRDRR